MELTWKDKVSYSLQELRTKLPFADEPKKQGRFFEISAGVFLIVIIGSSIFFFNHKTSQLFFGLPPGTNQTTITTSQASDTGKKSGGTKTTAPDALLQQHTPGNSQNPANQVTPLPYPTSTRLTTLPSPPADIALLLNGTSGANGSGGSTATNGSGTGTANSKGNSNGGSNSSGSSSNGGANGNGTGGANGGSNGLGDVPIFFADPEGKLQQYVPPTAPPVTVTWRTYYNDRDNYEIDYPSGWQIYEVYYNAHHQIGLYPPGMDPLLNIQDGLQSIVFGVTQFAYQTPYLDSTNVAYQTPVHVNGYSGTLYTQGYLHTQAIVVIINYGNEFFGIGGTASDDTMIYIYQHMLGTLHLFQPRN